MRIIKGHKYLFGALGLFILGMFLGMIFSNVALATFFGQLLGLYLIIGGPLKLINMIKKE